MKKITAAQKTRLAELSAQDELTASEEAEIQFLQSLESDSEEEEETEEEPETEDSDEEEEEEPEATDQGNLTIFQRAEATLRSKGNLVGQVATLKSELAEARETITTLDAQIVTLKEEAAEGRKLATRVAELEEQETTVSKKAARIAENNHVAEDDLPDSSDDPITGADHEAALAQLKGRDRAAYIRENRAAIDAANAGLN